MDALKYIAQDSLKKDLPQFSIGDTVRVDVKIREGDRERIQAFEGTVIAKKCIKRKTRCFKAKCICISGHSSARGRPPLGLCNR